MKIQSRQEFSDWLSEHYHYCEEIFVANLRPVPGLPDEKQQVPEAVSFDIGHPTSIDWCAGERTLFIFQNVLAKGITDWSSEDTDFDPDPIYADRGIGLVSASDALEIHIDNSIRLKCAELEISQPFEALYFNLPELSDRRVSIEVPSLNLPTPKQWVSWFEAADLSVAWRMIHDAARDPGEVPQFDYSGWFLQEADRINDTSSGLMISSCHPTESGFRVNIDFWKDQVNPEKLLWITLARVVADLPESRVVCGNCNLSGTDWYQSLENGQSYLDTLFPQQP